MSAAARTFGAHLRRLRTARSHSMRDLERLTSGAISKAYLSRLENGRIADPGLLELGHLSRVYGVDFGGLCRLWDLTAGRGA